MSKKSKCPVCQEPTIHEGVWCGRCLKSYRVWRHNLANWEAAEWGAEQARKAERRKAKEKR